MHCFEAGCPVWYAEEDAIPVTMEWRLRACDDVKIGGFTCLCDKPYKIAVCKNSARGNRGPLFFNCKETPQCDIFQWADTPRDREAIRAHHEVNGNTYSRENREQKKRASFRYVPRPPPLPKRSRHYHTSHAVQIEEAMRSAGWINKDYQNRALFRRDAPRAEGYTDEDHRRRVLSHWGNTYRGYGTNRDGFFSPD